MKKSLIISLFVILILYLSGCNNNNIISDSELEENSVICIANGFKLKAFSDKQTYKATEAISIWATLEYTGDGDTVKIWHGLPYMSFSITDGKDFNVNGLTNTILTSTVLQKGKIYHFDYKKSGGWTEEDPKADYWKKFFAEEELILPVGEYVITVGGAFSLSQDEISNNSELICELPIKVVK